MVITEDNSAGGLIEAAMGRLGGNWCKNEDAAQSRSRQISERALQQRLAQLKTAMGEGGEQPAVRPVPNVRSTRPAVATSAEGYQSSTLLLVALVSALIGAGAMRWATETRDLADTAVPVAVAPQSAEIPSPPVAMLPEVVTPDPDSEARAFVERWRQAWTARDVEAYLENYGTDFVPANGQNRTQWEAARRNAILGKAGISVQINDLKIVSREGNRLEVSFLQDYAAGSYRETARPKTLSLIRQGGRWTIARELQGA